MKEALQHLSREDSAIAITPSGSDAQLAQTMHDFLVWLEQTKALTLCHPFKPQYDWYMPAFSNKEKLVREFLGKPKPMLHAPLTQAVLT
jgi:hypothetical protein